MTRIKQNLKVVVQSFIPSITKVVAVDLVPDQPSLNLGVLVLTALQVRGGGWGRSQEAASGRVRLKV